MASLQHLETRKLHIDSAATAKEFQNKSLPHQSFMVADILLNIRQTPDDASVNLTSTKPATGDYAKPHLIKDNNHLIYNIPFPESYLPFPEEVAKAAEATSPQLKYSDILEKQQDSDVQPPLGPNSVESVAAAAPKSHPVAHTTATTEPQVSHDSATLKFVDYTEDYTVKDANLLEPMPQSSSEFSRNLDSVNSQGVVEYQQHLDGSNRGRTEQQQHYADYYAAREAMSHHHHMQQTHHMGQTSRGDPSLMNDHPNSSINGTSYPSYNEPLIGYHYGSIIGMPLPHADTNAIHQHHEYDLMGAPTAFYSPYVLHNVYDQSLGVGAGDQHLYPYYPHHSAHTFRSLQQYYEDKAKQTQEESYPPPPKTRKPIIANSGKQIQKSSIPSFPLSGTSYSKSKSLNLSKPPEALLAFQEQGVYMPKAVLHKRPIRKPIKTFEGRSCFVCATKNPSSWRKVDDAWYCRRY